MWGKIIFEVVVLSGMGALKTDVNTQGWVGGQQKAILFTKGKHMYVRVGQKMPKKLPRFAQLQDSQIQDERGCE